MAANSLKNRLVLITGATDGIGKQTALELARLGMRVLVHGRNQARCRAALDEIGADPGVDRGQLDFVAADFTSLNQVRQMAAEVQARYDPLPILINNAGVLMKAHRLTEDGLETTFMVNHLAPFLLTWLLLETIKRSAPARVINVSSMVHQGARVDFDNLQGEKHFDGYGAYALSKLGNILFTLELAERLRGSGVTVNCLHPGVIATKLLAAGYSFRGSDLLEGAETPVYLATSPEVAGVTGKYFVRKREVEPARQAYDEKLRHAFWEVSERLAGIS